MESSIITFLKIYFEFAYKLTVCPFRLEILQNHKFVLKTWWPQRIVCLIKSILSIFWAVGTIRFWVINGISKNPTMYFEFTLKSISFSLDIIGLKYFWLNPNKFLELSNTFINECGCKCNQYKYQNTPKKSSSKLFEVITCSIYLFMCVLKICHPDTLIFNDTINNGTVYTYKMNWWWNTLEKHGKYIFLFNEDNNYGGSVNTICGIFATVAYISRYPLILYVSLIIFY